MMRGAGIPLLEKTFSLGWFLGVVLLVLGYYGFMFFLIILRFCGFMALWFYGLWLYGVMALWFYGFVVLWVCGFMVLWFMVL